MILLKLKAVMMQANSMIQLAVMEVALISVVTARAMVAKNFEQFDPYSQNAGDDWDELERKAAKCMGPLLNLYFILTLCIPADLKRAEGTKRDGDSDSDDDRPKKKSAKGMNGKTKTKR